MARRRGNGEGAVYQRDSDGLWCTSVDLGIVCGKRKRKVIYGKARKEVAEKLRAMQQQRERCQPCRGAADRASLPRKLA